MIKKIVLFVVIVAIISIVGYVILPKPLYQPAVWGMIGDGALRKFQFSKYIIPEKYKMLSYRDNLPTDNKAFILFKNTDSGQYYATFVIKEIPKISFDKVSFENKKIIRTTARYYNFDISTDSNFQLFYLIPCLINEDYSEAIPPVIIRDIKVESKKEIDTEKTKVLLVDGSFQELGFYRMSKSLFIKYPVPVFSFKHPMKGMLAMISNKTNGDVIFAFGCAESYKNFDKNEFINIVKSVTFDKESRTLQDLFGSGTMKKYSR